MNESMEINVSDVLCSAAIKPLTPLVPLRALWSIFHHEHAALLEFPDMRENYSHLFQRLSRVIQSFHAFAGRRSVFSLGHVAVPYVTYCPWVTKFLSSDGSH